MTESISFPSKGLFVFRSRTGDRLKILYWDRSGYCLSYKRLDEGTFALPEGKARSVEMDAAVMAMLLEGTDAAGVREGRRFSLRGAAPTSPGHGFPRSREDSRPGHTFGYQSFARN